MLRLGAARLAQPLRLGRGMATQARGAGEEANQEEAAAAADRRRLPTAADRRRSLARGLAAARERI